MQCTISPQRDPTAYQVIDYLHGEAGSIANGFVCHMLASKQAGEELFSKEALRTKELCVQLLSSVQVQCVSQGLSGLMCYAAHHLCICIKLGYLGSWLSSTVPDSSTVTAVLHYSQK